MYRSSITALLILALFLLPPLLIGAQYFSAEPMAQNIKFERVSIDGNFPINGNVFQDSNGFIWLATWDGLYRFVSR